MSRNAYKDAELVETLKLIDKHGAPGAAKHLGIALRTVRERVTTAGHRGLTKDSTPKESLEAEVVRLKADLERATASQDTAARVRQQIYGLAERTAAPPKWLLEPGKLGKRGTPFLLCSDWHYGEIVRPEHVGGCNEFNSAVADKRIERLFKTAADLCLNHMGRQPVKYPGIICALAGDIITGAIHPDQIEVDATALQQVRAVKKKIIQGLLLLADTFGNVFVPCVAGNHGRDTLKPKNAGYVWHNYEWNLYTQLEDHFKAVGDTRVQFAIPEETDILFKSHGHRYLLTHGDNLGVKGGDGMIGALGPIMRGTIKVGRSEAEIGRNFDTLVMGHWHQRFLGPGNNVIVNNALKGYDTYARLVLRAPYSRPSQNLWFTHPEHGITAHWEVYLDRLRDANEGKAWVEVQK